MPNPRIKHPLGVTWLATYSPKMPHVAGDGLAAGLVAEAAQAVHSSLAAAGASNEEALEAGRRVSAEVARWMPRGRGMYVRRKRWIRR